MFKVTGSAGKLESKKQQCSEFLFFSLAAMAIKLRVSTVVHIICSYGQQKSMNNSVNSTKSISDSGSGSAPASSLISQLRMHN